MNWKVHCTAQTVISFCGWESILANASMVFLQSKKKKKYNQMSWV